MDMDMVMDMDIDMDMVMDMDIDILNWLDLPPELLLKIATSCDGIQNPMRGVCKAWKIDLEGHSTKLAINGPWLPLNNLASRFISLARLDLEGCDPPPAPSALLALRHLPSITSLSLRRCAWLKDVDLGCLAGLPLRSLNLTFCTLISDAGLDVLRGMPLRSLQLEGLRGVSDTCLEAARGQPLTDLFLCGGLSDASLEVLRGMPLSRLDLGHASNTFSEEGLRVLSGMPLTELNAANCPNFSVDCVLNAPLRRLVLATSFDVGKLKRFAHLVDLEVMTCRGRGRGLTNPQLAEMMGELKGMPLTRLHIYNGKSILYKRFSFLKGMPLTDLKLNCCHKINDYKLWKVLRGMPLQTLNISMCRKLTEKGVKKAARDALVIFQRCK